MSTFNSGTALRQIAMSNISGLMIDGPPLDLRLCQRLERDSITGSQPYSPTAMVAPRDVQRRSIGDEPEARDTYMATLDWDMGQYSKSFALTEAEMRDLSQYEGRIEEETLGLYNDVRIGRELDLKTKMGNYQDLAATGGTWDGAASKPVKSMQDALALVPGANRAAIGFTSAQELARHPDIKESIAKYSGGGGIPFSVLIDILVELLGFSGPESIVIWDTWYNTVGKGKAQSTTFTKAFVADDYFCAYVDRSLVLIEQPGTNDASGITVLEKHKTTETALTHILDHQAVEPTVMGVELTGI